MNNHSAWYLGPLLPILILVVILVAAFELWMLVDVALNKNIDDKTKAWWIIGMILVHPFVALVYLFTDRRKT